jgi:hypothetical protein
MKIYIAGPMLGKEDRNFPAFFAAEEKLKKLGYDVVNPARLSKDLADKMTEGDLDRIPRKEYIKQDLLSLVTCDAIYMLDGWDNSCGATVEKRVAHELELQILFDNQ